MDQQPPVQPAMTGTYPAMTDTYPAMTGTYPAMTGTYPAVTSTYPRQLTIKPVGFRDYEIYHNGDNNSALAYYCDVTRMSMSKPDVVLQRGAKGGPVAGASHYRSSRSITCGVGAGELSMVWTKLQHAGFLSKHFEFDWRGRRYALRRAKGEDFGGSALRTLVGMQFKIVDEATGGIVALFVTHPTIGRDSATLKLVQGVDAEFEVLVVLAVLSWRDKIRRTRAAGGAAAGGAGA